MKKTSGVFVKIDYIMDTNLRRNLQENKRILNNNDDEKYILCGGKMKNEMRTLIFKANTLDEAREIIYRNPFSKAEHYSYQILLENNLTLN